MKFTLKDYQHDAVIDVLKNLRKARHRWRQDGDRYAFSLTAATGAGKTVIAAAVFEALFHGDDELEFDRDPGAVVIWFSDDPSLNEQTRFRLIESSDRLRHTDLVVVENTFNRRKFDPGKIYFLNTQKLGKKSLLVRGYDDNEDGIFPEMRPDMRSHTIWDMIRNTIEDPDLSLYMVLDEAHRGMGGPNREKPTIVKRLINGESGVPGIPVIWGISATVERFNQAMDAVTDRITLPHVTVDPVRVQESGLLKDTIVLDIPDGGAAGLNTVLVSRATDKLRDSMSEWAAYNKQQGSGESVTPLMVLQVENKPSHKEIGRILESIFQRWPAVTEHNVAHVFGEHTPQTFGKYTVPYIQPQRVQDDTNIRILIAKDAISTGWDCPRAEVMISFRPAVDRTYIAQLLGRMVRTPLARRIPGSDRLNSVDCLLPKFDSKTVDEVVAALSSGGSDLPTVSRVLVQPKEMLPNSEVPEAVWEKVTSLPSQTLPRRGVKPALRLTALAHELAADGLQPGAGAMAHEAMHEFLDNFIEKRAKLYEEKRVSIMTVDGRTVIADMRKGITTAEQFQADSDASVIGDAFRRTARIISPDIARTYTDKRALRHPDAEVDPEGALTEASEEVAALHLMENLEILYDEEANTLADRWFSEHRDGIKKLTDDRQDAYRQIIALSTDPQDVDLARPRSRIEPTVERKAEGLEVEIPTFTHHLLCDAQELYPAKLNTSEQSVLKAEMTRDGFKFWYRNPSKSSQDSLGIAYQDGDDTKILRPDFIFLAEENGEIVADIVDPHSHHLADALPKLKGLASYAETHSHLYRRIEAVAELDGKLRVLDMMRQDVRQAVMAAISASALYNSAVAGDYS